MVMMFSLIKELILSAVRASILERRAVEHEH
jgi:hypothetical protein